MYQGEIDRRAPLVRHPAFERRCFEGPFDGGHSIENAVGDSLHSCHIAEHDAEGVAPVSDVIDLTLLSGMIQGVDREMRLMRLQLEQIAGGMPPRLSAVEQSFHGLTVEVTRGFGQLQQQLTRQEKRLDALDGGLATLRSALNESTAAIIEAIKEQS
jgi:hypothetical protein